MAVSDQAGVNQASKSDLHEWAKQQSRTSYFFDVRGAEEYDKDHLPGFNNIAGGQLVQETELYAPVKGARIVVVDDNGGRANMSATWLARWPGMFMWLIA